MFSRGTRIYLTTDVDWLEMTLGSEQRSFPGVRYLYIGMHDTRLICGEYLIILFTDVFQFTTRCLLGTIYTTEHCSRPVEHFGQISSI